MATFFDSNNNNSTSPEIQSSAAEGLLPQTLYLMNPNYAPFSDSSQNTTTQHNMLFLNPNNNTGSSSGSTHHVHALPLTSISHAPPQHHLIGLTIPSSNIIPGGFQGFSTEAGAPRVHYNLWGSIDSINDRSPSSTAAGVTVAAPATSPNNTAHAAATTVSAAEIGFHRPGGGLQQGLSLSLSSQQPGYRSLSGGEMDAVSPASRGGGNENGISSMHSVVLRSKYLKVAQELLDEVVNVGKNKGISMIEGSSSNNKEKMKGNIIAESSGGGENDNNNKQGGELSTAQKQELQMKKSKLVNMLDEVDQRYRQYHHQMQVVISSFGQAAGYGAARSYTSVALETISKQFRCLKDAISSQIRESSKALGEQEDGDFLGAKFRFVDHHLRQQRALQQLGMIHHHQNNNAWRPQRGLPERAVSILRAWLFEHFLHPYPKDSDKVILAKQTGLTRSQVSNWFINARVRLWKPMVEEMYLEELKDQDHNNNNNTTSKQDNNNNVVLHEPSSIGANNNVAHQNTSPTEISNSNNNNTIISSTLLSPNMGGGGGHSGNFLLSSNSSKPQNSQSSILSSSLDMESMNHNNKHNRDQDTNNNNIKFGIIDEMNHNVIAGGYGGFSVEDIGRFNHHHHHHQQQLASRFHGNGVSLTLGLPPSDQNNNHNLLPHISETQHSGFLSSHLGGNNNNENHEFCGLNSTTTPPHPASSHSGTSYDNIDMQNRKRFSAHQLLRDYVA